MRKLVVSINITLDGFMAGPNGELDWHFPLWNEEMADFACEQLCMMDSIVLGRVTYEAMSRFWPYQSMENTSGKQGAAFANMMNNYEKIVFSKTLQRVEWKNARLIKNNITREIIALKKQPGMDMIIYGSGNLVLNLMRQGLIDEYVLWIHPILLGKGKPLFRHLTNNPHLKLLKTKAFSSGVVILYYGLEAGSAVLP